MAKLYGLFDMNFFDGLDFVVSGCSERNGIYHRKSFKDYYGVQFFNGDSFEASVGSKSWRLEGPWVLITYPGPFFQYGPPQGATTLHSYVCFRGPRVDFYLSSGLLPLDRERPLVKISAPQRFQEAMSKLIHAVKGSNSKSGQALAVNLLENALLQLQSQPEPLRIAPRLRTLIESLEEELRERPELEWNFHSEAKRLGVSYIYLRTLFRKIAGLAPGAFLLEARIEKAASLLLGSEMQVSEIAKACGFSDEFYFSRAFKKRRAIPPLRYRQEFSSSCF